MIDQFFYSSIQRYKFFFNIQIHLYAYHITLSVNIQRFLTIFFIYNSIDFVYTYLAQNNIKPISFHIW